MYIPVVSPWCARYSGVTDRSTLIPGTGTPTVYEEMMMTMHGRLRLRDRNQVP